VPRDGVMALGARHASLFLHPRRKHDVSCNFVFAAGPCPRNSLLFLDFQPSGVYFCAWRHTRAHRNAQRQQL